MKGTRRRDIQFNMRMNSGEYKRITTMAEKVSLCKAELLNEFIKNAKYDEEKCAYVTQCSSE